MPHTDFNEPIEYGPLALVPHNDQRLIELADSSKAVDKLLTSFTDQFGVREQPSAILVRSNALPKIDFYAVACFRNAIAISSIIEGSATQLAGGTAGYPLWSDSFDLYAFTITLSDNLMAWSSASHEVNDSDSFVGQRAPQIPSGARLHFGIDRDILAGCLRLWDRRFVKRRRERSTRILFRSLEIAYQASRVPAAGSHAATIHDLGTGRSLWVSALEILSHPMNGNANLQTVVDLLGRFPLEKPKLQAKRFNLTYRGNTQKVNWLQKLYHELYKARNDFLHGNDVSLTRLYPSRKKTGPTLLRCAPLIFKAALTAFLPPPKSRQPRNLTEQTTQYLFAYQSLTRYERALYRTRYGKK
jgi:hypothetical protein